MEPNVVNQVVDKLAEKIGIAAEKLAPVAEEAIRQVSHLGIANTILGFLCLCATAILCRTAWRSCKCVDRHSEAECAVGLGAICAIAAMVLCCIGIVTVNIGLSQWLAPLPHLLGK